MLDSSVYEGGTMELLIAAETGDLDRVQALLSQGIDKNTADSNGDTALLKAAANGHLLVVTR